MFGMEEQVVVHRGYSATERQIGHIYNGRRITRRRKIPKYRRWLYDGRVWEFYGVPVTEFERQVDEMLYDSLHGRRGIETTQAQEMIYRWRHQGD